MYGVIVALAALAKDVAFYAHRKLRHDKASRREKYEKLGLEPDETVS